MSQPVANLLCNGVSPAVITTTSTSVQYFPWIPGASIGAAPSSNQPVAGFIPIPGSSRANGQRLNVRATGNLTEGADSSSPTITVGLYYIIAPKTIYSAALTDIKSLFTVATSTAGVGSTTGTPWTFAVDLNADTISGLLQGNYTFQIKGAATNTGATTIVTGVDMSQDQPLALCVGITFSQDGTHQNTARLYQFDLQQ